MPKQIIPPTILPRRQIFVIADELVPGLEFSQPTKSGSTWILFWVPESDRLYRWNGRWVAIKPQVISAQKKQFLNATSYR